MAVMGIGSGTSKMVYNNSGGESSSMGYIDAKVDRRPTRKGGNLA